VGVSIMDKLFGVPAQQLMWVLLAVFAAGGLTLAVLAARDRTSIRMAVRNLPRRRTQTALIVAGLMLATLLFSAAFTTGDTLTESLRTQALKNIGRVDVVVKAEQPESGGGVPFGPGAGGPKISGARERYFDESIVGEVRDHLSDVKTVAGVAPLAKESVPVTARATGLSEPRIDVLGMDAASMKAFDALTTATGKNLALEDLGENEVYVSEETAEGLGVGPGDRVEAFLVRSSGELNSEESSPELKVAGIYERGANPASDTSMVMPLGNLQKLTGEEGEVNEVLVTHGDPAVEGGKRTDSTVDAIQPLLADNGLQADPVKKDAVEGADQRGEIFSTLFVLFGQFSVAAGMLLIFLIFVMLAAERKKELGIARAVGMQRSNLVRTFAFEGALYALVAGALGSIAGIGVGWIMVRLIGRGIAGESGFQVSFATSPENAILAFCMGMVLTFVVVLISSWRVSRLNVVRAIRDIPEPDRGGRTVWGVILTVLVPVAGAIAFWQGIATGTMAFYLGGLSLVLVGVALLARVLGAPDRVAFTVSGLVLLTLWLLPASFTTPAGMAKGPEMFFISGISIVIAGVWLVIFNADALLWLVVATSGRIKGLSPVLKTAVKYPTQSLFRTGMTLAMFMLVVFTLAAMSFIQAAMGAAFENMKKLSGGYEIQGNAGYAAPISDMKSALKDSEGIESGEVTAVGQVSNLPAAVNQKGVDQEPEDVFVQGVDEGYSDSVNYGFQTIARGYSSSREVWNALQTEKDTVVISGDLAPSRNSSGFGPAVEPPVKLTGFYADDQSLPDDLYLRIEDPDSGKTRNLRVIGVLESSAYFAGDVVASQGTLDSLADHPLPPQTYYFGLGSGVDASTIAKSLEKDFASNGLQTQVTAQMIRDNDAMRRIVFTLLRGFMGLGLVVGIAALGVIAARSVVERRQQIGMMRALGFQKGQVRLVFLIESSFIALLGIGIGVALALGFSGTLIDNISQNIPGLEYQVPWSELLLVILVGYVASLLTTYLPARQASKIYPAEALRYE
jgi:putative ABC transport system permease protein